MRNVSSKNRVQLLFLIFRYIVCNILCQAKEKGASKGLSGNYLEGGDDSGDEAGAFSIAAIKAKYKKGGAGKDKKPIYSSDEEDSDVENKKGKRLQKAKGMDSDSDSDRSRS